MNYLSDIQKSTKALTNRGYRLKSATRLNKLKHKNIDYVMTSDVFQKYSWLVGLTQYRRFSTRLSFNLGETEELYKTFEISSYHKLLNEFKLSMGRLLVGEILDEQEFKKEQKLLRNFLKSNNIQVKIYSTSGAYNTRYINYVLLGKDGKLYTFNGYKGLLELIKNHVI